MEGDARTPLGNQLLQGEGRGGGNQREDGGGGGGGEVHDTAG